MFRRKPKAPEPRAPEVIEAEARQLEGLLGQKEYMRRCLDAEAAQLAQRLLELNQEHAAAKAAQPATTQAVKESRIVPTMMPSVFVTDDRMARAMALGV